MTDYIPHEPTPKQAAFLLLDDLDVFYGGAAGGGKSDALLMAALQYVDCPQYRALVVRATYRDLSLPEAIMDRAKSWLAEADVRWNDQDKTFTFPSGARVVFGYLDKPEDHRRYQSAEFHFVGIDEITELRWNQALFLFTRLRKKTGDPIPLRYRCAGNPGGRSHVEVKARYIDPETREDRIFIPANLNDNPFLDKTSYVRNLNQVDHLTRQRLLKGDWNITAEGGMFRREWFPVVGASPLDCKRVRWWDMASTEQKKGNDPDYAVGARLGVKDGIVYIEDMVRVRTTPQALERIIRQTAELDGTGTRIWMEQEPGSAGKIVTDYYARQILMGFEFRCRRSTGNKDNYASPLSAHAESGNVRMVKGGWNRAYLDELECFPVGAHDDMVDASSKAFCILSGFAQKRAGVWGGAVGRVVRSDYGRDKTTISIGVL